MRKNFWILLIILVCGTAAYKPGQKKNGNMEKEAVLKTETSLGDIKMKSYNGTLKHRGNFIKLAEDGTYNGTLFYHVIRDFMVQAGSPESKNAPKGKILGSDDVGYTAPAEFVYPKYFHKRGALSATRQGGEINPDRESSGCQFYIVVRKVFSGLTLLNMEQQRNQSKVTEVFNVLAQKRMKGIYKVRKVSDQDGPFALQDTLFIQAEVEAARQPDFHSTPEQIKAYTTVGSILYLDSEYMVLREVIEGIDVIDKTQWVKADRSDRSEEDMKIIDVSVIE